LNTDSHTAQIKINIISRLKKEHKNSEDLKAHTHTKARADPGGRLQLLPPLKPTKITLFTMIFYNSENSIHE